LSGIAHDPRARATADRVQFDARARTRDRLDAVSPSGMRADSRAILRTLRWLALAGWFGSWALFAFGVAPLAFRVLPSGQVAGELVSPLLRILHLYGLAAGLALAAIARARRDRWPFVAIPAVLALLAGFSEFGITHAIAGMRPSTFGPATPPDAAARFALLHQASRVVFGVVLAGTAGLIAMHARGEEPHRD